LPIESWKPSHIIGYFCSEFKKHYNTDYKFKLNNPAPSKSFEVFQIKKLCSLLSSQPVILKEYIDWVFDIKVVKAKKKFRSISFLTTEDILSEYKKNVLFAVNATVNRSTELPDKYKNVLRELGLFANNYGDLAFLSKMERTSEIDVLFNKLSCIGFDNSVLSRIV
jgi:hypothetical protein